MFKCREALLLTNETRLLQNSCRPGFCGWFSLLKIIWSNKDTAVIKLPCRYFDINWNPKSRKLYLSPGEILSICVVLGNIINYSSSNKRTDPFFIWFVFFWSSAFWWQSHCFSTFHRLAHPTEVSPLWILKISAAFFERHASVQLDITIFQPQLIPFSFFSHVLVFVFHLRWRTSVALFPIRKCYYLLIMSSVTRASLQIKWSFDQL